jgi:predicted nucleotidyltransferase
MERLTDEDLETIVDRLREALDPVAVILYGSHADGSPDEASDVDVLVVDEATEATRHELAVEGSLALDDIGTPVELRVDTVEEFEELKKWVSSVEREAWLRRADAGLPPEPARRSRPPPPPFPRVPGGALGSSDASRGSRSS